ncbi:hypothetical protein POTOM_027964 [Populus tomentosa]|uniref:Uncharacterized protein n=1 Tax=Populus tomentosa TaxID=118781 RepID=A0A8X8CUD5_POPTO|nr:hypothetical protein POTOM_027964 [Populus tomentosa]
MNANYHFLLLWISQIVFCTGKVEKASCGFCSPQTDSPEIYISDRATFLLVFRPSGVFRLASVLQDQVQVVMPTCQQTENKRGFCLQDKRLPTGTTALLKLEEFVAKFMSMYRKSSGTRQYV